jgi:hypothetical protein
MNCSYRHHITAATPVPAHQHLDSSLLGLSSRSGRESGLRHMTVSRKV